MEQLTLIKPIAGIVPIVAAPFTASGALDTDSFKSLVRHLIGTGASGLTLFGLATEFYKLSDDERARMQLLLLAETSRSGAVAGIISITDHSWELAVVHARAAEAQGADGLMLLPPYFLGPGEAAILEHLRRVIGSVRIPVIVQYAPAQTGVRIAPELFLRLRAELPNADFVKVETSPPGPYVSQLIGPAANALAGLRALVGYAGVQMPDVLARGAAGIQPGCSFTEVYVELWRLWHIDPSGFQRLHAQLLPYISYWMQSVELIVKAEKVMEAADPGSSTAKETKEHSERRTKIRLTINTDAVWRDWARDQAQAKDTGPTSKDIAKGKNSVATKGEPLDANSSIIVEIVADSKVETRFRTLDDETSKGDKKPEGATRDEASKAVEFHTYDLKPGLFIEVDFKLVKTENVAKTITVIRPITSSKK